MLFKNLEDVSLEFFKKNYFAHNNETDWLPYSISTCIQYDTSNKIEYFLVIEYDERSSKNFTPYRTSKTLGSRFIDILNLDSTQIKEVIKDIMDIVFIKGVATNSFYKENRMYFNSSKINFLITKKLMDLVAVIDIETINRNIEILNAVKQKLMKIDYCFFDHILMIDDFLNEIYSFIHYENNKDLAQSWGRAILDFGSLIVKLNNLIRKISSFKMAVDFCLNRDYATILSRQEKINLLELTPTKRFYVFCNSFDGSFAFRAWQSSISFNEKVHYKRSSPYNISEKMQQVKAVVKSLDEKDVALIDTVEISGDFHDFFYSSLINMLRLNISVAQCRSCGKLFIPTTRSDEIYCNNVYRKGKTCRQLDYEDKINSNEVLKAYRTAYKTQNAKKLRNRHKTDVEERFKKWHMEAKRKLADTQDGKMNLADFKVWLKDDWWL